MTDSKTHISKPSAMCSRYPLLKGNVYYSSKSTSNGYRTGGVTFGLANQKGLYFNCGSLLMGRDGVSRLVDKTYDDGFDFNYFLAARLMAILDVIQFLIFGTLTLAITCLVFVISIVTTCVFGVGVICSNKSKLLFWSSIAYLLACMGNIFAHIVIYPMLALEVFIPELLFKVMKMNKWGYEVPEDLP